MRLNPKIPIQSFECSSPSVGVKDGCLLSRHWRRRAAVVSLDSAHYNGDRWWHFHCGKNIYKHLSSCSHIAINSAVRLSVRRVPYTHCCAWIWPKMWLVLDIWASWKRHLAIILVFFFFFMFSLQKVNWSKSSSRLLLWSWRTKRWTSRQFYAPAMWGQSSSTGGLTTKQRRVLFSHFPTMQPINQMTWQIHSTSLCVSGVFQPVVTLDGAMSFTFSKEGSHTVSVQAAVGNTVLQDQMAVAVYGKSYIHIFILLSL